MTHLAHTVSNPDGSLREHELKEHLSRVSQMAASFAAVFGAGNWAGIAGVWHDLGKYRPGFQRYIRECADAHIEGRVTSSDKTHSAAGALWAENHLVACQGQPGRIVSRVLVYLIAGHHAGLDNWHDGLKVRLAGNEARRELEDCLGAAPPEAILNPPGALPDPRGMSVDTRNGAGSFAMWVRMLFSCLVDADFLDTESFMAPDKAATRAQSAKPAEVLSELQGRFDAHMTTLAVNARNTPVNALRADVLAQCCTKAALSPGVFTLTVPTGGGKTLSSLAFGLRHAVAHGKRRVIYAIPYTSIIEQTADIFRAIFGDENIVEHHSNADADAAQETARSRLACENWDAPLIVTTNVQLFESLFARRTSRCRKLHNLVGSVIVLDEAQLLPVGFLQPILDVLRLLVRDYGVTLVLCTATQPALSSATSFDPRRGLRGFAADEVTEIIDDVPALYTALKRIQVRIPASLDARREWPDIAQDIARHEAVLAIVNRRRDARELHRLLKTHEATGLWHLSALMCPQHRSDTIARIKDSLVARREALAQGIPAMPVRVVSTQLVEAGVDMSFPVVFRALAGLDSIAQAGGRCNREGELDGLGEVHVFVPPTEPPTGLLRQARDTCRKVWHRIEGDPLDLRLFPAYFRQLYGDADLDARGICEMLRVGREADVRFRDASDAFRLIDDEEAATVIVRYPGGDSHAVDQWIAILERDGAERWLMRKLQRYGVSIYRHDAARLMAQGDIRELGGFPGVYVQVADTFYDSVLGANVEGAPGDPAKLVI
ncbi:CRISPR-associated endonuclease Cas3'' [Aromatoleum aromaticum]|uniref:CRISPR-associated endonuclease Cas3'' n=1 Tax=Aromatoleum aromaticum TaxID=551760 RepID=UPI0014596C95|nr:CRISPR-associated endonuclease Cas3'' [Aromatoleum aromaticum]NMG55556.1 CRISPR-associated endonuclease Cas3'' [Aromatoleum aromaticum]